MRCAQRATAAIQRMTASIEPYPIQNQRNKHSTRTSEGAKEENFSKKDHSGVLALIQGMKERLVIGSMFIRVIFFSY